VHLNPVRLASYKRKDGPETSNDLERYSWSSLRGYVSAAQKQFWMAYDMVLGYVGGRLA
jgi:hypothetical protein